MKDYAIIYNPTSAAGKSKKMFELMQSTLQNMQIQYDLFQTEYFGHAIPLAEQLANDGYRVIAAGGDGTCNEVLNGVIQSKTKALLGFIPIGTGNDIPATIGYAPKNVKAACTIIKNDHHGIADVGVASNSTGGERYFLGIGSQGFDAAVTKRTNEGSKWLPGTWNYINSVVASVFKFRRQEVSIHMDSGEWTGQCNLVAVGNGPSYGGGMFMCPHATAFDSKFHVSVVDMNSLELLYKFNTMYSKTLHPDPHIEEFVCETITISMKNPDSEPYIAQVDGEIIGNLPVSYSFLEGGYEFILPKENEADHQFMQKYGKKFTRYCRKLKEKGNIYWQGSE